MAGIYNILEPHEVVFSQKKKLICDKQITVPHFWYYDNGIFDRKLLNVDS